MDEQQMNAYLKGAVEALLFIGDKPVEIEQMKEALETFEAGEIRQAVKLLQEDYEREGRGIRIIEIAGGFQMLTNPQYAEYLRNFFKTRVKEKLSRPALEALAIIAYRQPVSRADVELIRGVNSDGVVAHLLDKGLIRITGRKDVPGRPFLYGTARLFLEYFGLKSLKDLPKLEDVSELLEKAEQVGAAAGQRADLFDSNKAMRVEEAVTDFGGRDHLRQSFAREDSAEFVVDDEETDMELNAPEELKEAMDQMAREQFPGDDGQDSEGAPCGQPGLSGAEQEEERCH